MVKIELTAEKRQYADKVTNEIKSFYVYYVEVNGIKIYLKPTENIGRQLLEMYLKGGDEK